MLEANTFRSMMLIGGIMTLAVVIACFFTLPMVPVNAQEKANYENVMNEDIGEANHLSAYQAILFYVQGVSRGSTEHY